MALTLIPLELGQGLRELPPSTMVPGLAAALCLGFGLRLLIDAQRLDPHEAEEEEQEAEQVIHAAASRRRLSTSWAVIWEAFVLVFIAALGDRTQFTTLLLATAPVFSWVGLLAGPLLGHALVTWLAVGAGQ